jgi:hypothetical protein
MRQSLSAASRVGVRLSGAVLASLALVSLAAASASSQTIEFTGIGDLLNGVPNGVFTGPVVEDGFVYDLLPGSPFTDRLWGEDSIGGNPVPHMEGHDDNGTLRIVKSGGGNFTFDGADIAQWELPLTTVTFEGFLGGISQGTDSYVTSAANDVWSSHTSVVLSGVHIDELRVVLNGGSSGLDPFEQVDNIVLGEAIAEIPALSQGHVLLIAAILAAWGCAYLRRRFPAA